MAHVATLYWEPDEFYFVSDDGERWYEVNPAPETDADLDHLRPLGIVDDRIHRLAFDKSWLMHRPPGQHVVFSEVK